ncbi:F-box/LRR-repeat protein 3-like [Impatiens glandulifera]|uniref:F-box/LRR-repeat protein 3-like n=1 Tax=Impatiens glandulifera TaxID=253017 RepID=UPI001FB14B4B|nr:F-box/LRR-repeat protein 3-like [Impatiens glandulifera]
MEQEDSSPILSLLTDDLLLRVLNNLPDESDRKTFRSVCKTFLRLDSIHRTSLRILRTEFLPTLLRRYQRIESLDLSVCPRIDDGTVAILMGGVSFGWSQSLRTLILSRSSGLRSGGLERLIRVCPNLEIIDVSYSCDFGDREVAALSFSSSLKDLKMDKCLAVTDVGLAKIAVGCSNLERLSLKWCFKITDLGIDLLTKKCFKLKYLDISYLKVTNHSLMSIASLQRLEVLAMVASNFVDDEGLHHLGNGCPSLQILDLSRCDKISTFGLSSVMRGHHGLLQIYAAYSFFEFSTSILNQVKNMRNLKTIRIDGARINEASFEILATNCKSLVEVGLSKCKGVTDSGLRLLAEACSSLRHVNLTCCNSITDLSIISISQFCKGLLILQLEACILISYTSLRCLGVCSSQLKELDLTDCSGVNDTGLRFLSGCSQLACLKLGLCTNISDEGLSYIASKCRNIHELDLYRCTGIGDGGLAAISTGCKKMKKLNISYCYEVTDEGIKWLGYLEELSDLELRNLVKVTGSGLAAIASGCKKLSDLDLKSCINIQDSGFWALAYYRVNLRQINLSHCGISDAGLCMVLGNLTRLQDAKLVNLRNVTVQGYELSLRACCARLKKVKLLANLSFQLSHELQDTLRIRGCRIRWD